MRALSYMHALEENKFKSTHPWNRYQKSACPQRMHSNYKKFLQSLQEQPLCLGNAGSPDRFMWKSINPNTAKDYRNNYVVQYSEQILRQIVP